MAQEPQRIEGPEDPANEQPLVSHLIELRNTYRSVTQFYEVRDQQYVQPWRC